MTAEIIDEDTIALVRQLRDIRKAKAKLKKDEDDFRKQIIERLAKLKADAGLTASGAPVVHITVSYRTRVIGTMLQAKYPAIYTECSEENPVVTVNTDIED